MASDLKAWDRIPEESDPAWEAFVIYRDLGPGERTLAKVAKELRKSATLIERWSQRWDWPRRSGLWDVETDQAKQRGILGGIEEMEKRHTQIARLVQQKVVDRLRELTIEELSPGQIIQWFDVAVKIERMSAGKATDILGEAAIESGEIPVSLSKADREKIVSMAQVIKRARLRAVKDEEVEDAG